MTTPHTRSPSTLQDMLRSATRLPHRALDHHPLLAPLLTQDVSVVKYGNALSALHGVYTCAEQWIFHGLDQLPCVFDYRARCKVPKLESDLALLHRQPVPGGPDIAAPWRIGALVGILYTIEGSTLGGQVIARLLRQYAPPGIPLQFFSGYGELTGQRWSEFMDFAQSQCPANDYPLAVSASVNLFEAIKTHLDRAMTVLAQAPANLRQNAQVTAT